MTTHGLVLGKFLPPHAGHLYLGDFARRMSDELTVVVGTLEREPIPGTLRFQWMRELCHGAQVVHLDQELPQEPAEHPRFWELWREALTRVVPRAVDLVFASEDYGARLAQELGASFVHVDVARDALDVSGTAVRANPFEHWHHLPAPVRAYATQRISVYGPESCGKTTLARDLARHFGTAWAPEYARAALERGAELSAETLRHIMRAQAASEDAAARHANRRLFCDTDPSVTPLWSQLLLGEALAPPPARHYDLTLLLRPDVAFVEDEVRYAPAEREAFYGQCRELLHASDRPFIEIGGSFSERFEAAVRAVEALPVPNLNRPRGMR